MSNEIQLWEKIPDPIKAAEQMGMMFAKSGLFGCEKTETGMVLALACMSEKVSPFELLRTYHIVENKLAMRSDFMLSKFRSMGGRVKWKQFDAIAAVADWTFEGVTTEIGFTFEDAKKMGLVKERSGWVKNPDAMLRARCIAKAVRMIAPEVIAGCMSPEEIYDGEGAQAPASEPKSLLGSKAKTEPKADVKVEPPAKEESKVIEVSATVVPEEKKSYEAAAAKLDEGIAVLQKAIDTGNEAIAKEEKTQQEQPAEPPKTKKRIATDFGGKLTAETLGWLMELIGDKEQQACGWLTRKGWIENSSLATLKLDKAQLILNKPDIFQRNIAAFKV